MSKNRPVLIQNRRVKLFRSKGFNYTFDLRSGNFMRWGRLPGDNPQWSAFGPEIVDIEISEGAGCPMSCAFCYKGNKPGNASTAKNMSFDTFKRIFDKLPHTTTKNGKRLFFTTQIAFGITSVNSNPDLFEMMDYCRENSVIPNITINGADKMDDYTINRLADTCGAISVSINHINIADGYTLIKKLTDVDAAKINIHYVLSVQSLSGAYIVINDIKNDRRLTALNSIVFLGLKPKSRGSFYDILSDDEYTKLIVHCLDNNINFGFDSCSAPKFEKSLKSESIKLSKEQKKTIKMNSERCESALFSAYIDCDGKYWHCSFGEGNEESGGIDLLNTDKDFMDAVWKTEQVENWRWKLLKQGRECLLYPEINPVKEEAVVL